MNYDLSKPESLPLALGVHILVDTRTGATFEGKGHHAYQAMGQALKAMTGTEPNQPNSAFGDQFGEEGAKQITDFAMAVFFASMMHDKSGLDEFVGKPDGLLRVGPFVTWDECLHNKHSELMTQRMERFATGNLDSGGPVPAEQIDLDIAAQMRKDIVDQRAEHAAKASTSSSKDPLEEILAQVFGGGFGLRRGR